MSKISAEAREKARECRQLASQARSQVDADAWLALAGDWSKLAEDAGRSGQPDGLSVNFGK